ncbi:TPA: hypothetical protein ACU967_005970 [Burkholderia contaminans]|uniref:hypothetical protein n=1 Tax=Burkholderia TaxID=32008 RepID=UPI00075E7B0B|nr:MULTISPECIES: hypothetical protein [Burkholderia]KVS22067.1 hypothetical protein WK34_20750 [Burkholderia vietnamiensis]MBM6430584.1 hypothetical protein [Burkholderia contaminans]MCA7880833.1 hypothetical protein [Burkholderia contaminans]MCB4349263.1 hypothetical protein [Burkholderia vietnamiensis]MDN8025843.1 hypothetical protein [Burkholderia contaminans]
MDETRNPPAIGSRLNDKGWQQGAIAGAAATATVVAALRRQGRDDLADQLERGDACAIAISQTCDIVCVSDEAEPYLEFAVAAIRAGAPNPQDTFLKSFRRFAARLTDGARHLTFRPWDRCLVGRAALVDATPSDDLAIDRRACQDLVDWLTMRYKRAALPDAFNERLKRSGAEDKLRKALAAAPAITEIFLLLNPRHAELTDESVPYQCDVVLLCRRDVYTDSAVREAIEPVVLEFETILAAVPGIEVENVHLRGEHDFSRHAMREYDRWQFDDVSYAADYRATKNPSSAQRTHAYSVESSRGTGQPKAD